MYVWISKFLFLDEPSDSVSSKPYLVKHIRRFAFTFPHFTVDNFCMLHLLELDFFDNFLVLEQFIVYFGCNFFVPQCIKNTVGHFVSFLVDSLYISQVFVCILEDIVLPCLQLPYIRNDTIIILQLCCLMCIFHFFQERLQILLELLGSFSIHFAAFSNGAISWHNSQFWLQVRRAVIFPAIRPFTLNEAWRGITVFRHGTPTHSVVFYVRKFSWTLFWLFRRQITHATTRRRREFTTIVLSHLLFAHLV